MAQCPDCGKHGALIFFSKIECPSEKCRHYVGDKSKICGCCGQIGHIPSEDVLEEVDTEPDPDTAPPEEEAAKELPYENQG